MQDTAVSRSARHERSVWCADGPRLNARHRSRAPLNAQIAAEFEAESAVLSVVSLMVIGATVMGALVGFTLARIVMGALP